MAVKLIVFLLIFLIPANLAKHFPIDSSYVSGYLVDYLIPTVYLTDILIVLLLIFKPLKKIPKLLAIFLLLLLPAVFLAQSPIPAAYKWLKFLEIGLLIAWAKQYKPRIDLPLLLAVIFQSLLAIAQWLKQASIFGYWFLGEQPFNPATAGIDKITWINGALKIPPMGTTPHPNVLAGFLVVALAVGLNSKAPKILKWLAGILGTASLFLTFSLSGWLAWLLLGIPGLIKKKVWIYYVLIIITIIFAAKNFSFLAPDSSFSRRSQLAQIATYMFKEHPIAGVGLNNFTVTMDNYGYIPASTRWLQPVHNIYLLILSETGIFGVLGFGYLLIKSKKSLPLFILLFLGLFDHYPLTLQTGMLLFVTNVCLQYSNS
jgi:O-antigen ligase